MEKKMLLQMKWGEIPGWWWTIMLWPIISWIIMWPAKFYVSDYAAYFFLANWALGTSIYVFILMFHPYQYPRKR